MRASRRDTHDSELTKMQGVSKRGDVGSAVGDGSSSQSVGPAATWAVGGDQPASERRHERRPSHRQPTTRYPVQEQDRVTVTAPVGEAQRAPVRRRQHLSDAGREVRGGIDHVPRPATGTPSDRWSLHRIGCSGSRLTRAWAAVRWCSTTTAGRRAPKPPPGRSIRGRKPLSRTADRADLRVQCRSDRRVLSPSLDGGRLARCR